MHQLLSIKEAARILGKGDRTLRLLVQKYQRGEDGGIRAAKIGRDWRISEPDLEAFISKHYPALRRRRTA